MLREVRKAVELEKKMKIGEEIVKMEEAVVDMKEVLSGLPKPSFLANQLAADQESQKEAPPPRKKKGKKTVRFLLTSVSKRKLHLDDEEEEVEGLKRSREERLLAVELDQIGSMMANMFQKSKFVDVA